MLIKRLWIECCGPTEWHREGWYLLGILPLYIRDLQPRERRRQPPSNLRVNITT